MTSLKIERTPKGVRRIPINVRSLTGEVNGQEFESSLERDLLLLAHWDNEVEWYQSQPVKIEYTDPNGKLRSYTPDLLISFKTDRKPLLCEVKYRSDYAEQWKLLKPKFRAACAYAKANGYEFRVMTEREIRTVYLDNIQFLWSYRTAEYYPEHYEKLKSVLGELVETDPSALLDIAGYTSKFPRGEALWTLWCMIARDWIQYDPNIPLTMKSRIRIAP
ncbi:MAG: TnsA endonuclease N-terminal domain-containing protein [Gallionella sp.]|nr:TnsA endonuclease N-terminal domain-containing protein [Gallionella sp.]